MPSTLEFTAAGDRLWDVIVVGAGPAGSLAARQLAQQGAAVLLVDKAAFPRTKVCGSCLNALALTTLKAVGLGELLHRHGAIGLHTFHVTAQKRHALLHLPEGASLSRQVFDAALIEAALQAGASFLPMTQARLDACEPSMRYLTLQHQGEEIRAGARIVIAADGLGSGLLSRESKCQRAVEEGSRLGAGVVADHGPGFYGWGTVFMACGTGGYVGLVRLEDGRLNVAAAFDPAWVMRAGGLGKAAAAILSETGFPPVAGLAELPWRGTPLLTNRTCPVACPRLFVIGDAAGYVEPFTGEGIACALSSAIAVAPLVLRACRKWEPSIAEQWSLQHREIAARRQRICRLVSYVLRRPSLTRALILSMARTPILLSPVIDYLNSPASILRSA